MAIYHIRPDRSRPPGWQILSVADIHFFVEPSFLIFIGIIMLVNLQGLAAIPSARSQAISEAGLFGFIIFFSLMAHEAGHALAARLFGYRDIYVSLVALGGRTLHPPATRGQSLLITLAGPAATLLLVGAAWGILAGVHAPWMEQDVSRFIARNFFWLNLAWAVFNLLPVFPMDGGRTLLYILTYMM
jgi:Zn-dependent protease